MRHVHRSLGTFAALLLAASRPADAQAWKDSLRTALTQTFALTGTTRGGINVTTPGTVLAAAVPGIDVSPPDDRNSVSTKVHDGTVQKPRGLSRFLVREHHRDLRVGERAYVTDIKVRDDAVTLYLLVADPERIMVNGNSRDVRYVGVVDFEFDKAAFATLSADSVGRAIVVTLRPAETAAAPPPAATPKTQVSLAVGQSIEEVERALGKPESVLQLGTKTIYVYRAVKVTFVDGKVVDVQ